MKIKVFIAREGLVLLSLAVVSMALYGASKYEEHIHRHDSFLEAPAEAHAVPDFLRHSELLGPPRWKWIESNPEYIKLSDSDKALEKNIFFDRVIAADPKYKALSDQDKKRAKDTFLGSVNPIPPPPADPADLTPAPTPSNPSGILRIFSFWLLPVAYIIYWLLRFVFWARTTLASERSNN